MVKLNKYCFKILYMIIQQKLITFIGLKIICMYWKIANFSICDPVTIVTVNIAPTYLLFYVYLDSLDHLLHVYQVITQTQIILKVMNTHFVIMFGTVTIVIVTIATKIKNFVSWSGFSMWCATCVPSLKLFHSAM